MKTYPVMQANSKKEVQLMLPGETILSGAPRQCPDCKARLVTRVLRSGAGYYLGTECNCGPYSRESHYFESRAVAEAALPDYLEDSRSPQSARTKRFQPASFEVRSFGDCDELIDFLENRRR